ncbi:MAG: hypothetical protein AB1453_13365 [Chloroflexota bacterium]
MQLQSRVIIVILVVVLLLIALTDEQTQIALAESGITKPFFEGTTILTPVAGRTPTATPPVVSRANLSVSVPYFASVWRLVRLPENVVDCVLVLDRESEPTEHEISQNCTPAVVNLWRNQSECPGWGADGNLSTCKGEYLQRGELIERYKKITGDFPLPTVWLNLKECVAIDEFPNRCYGLPKMEITAEEPIPGEKITRIEARIGSETFSCDTNPCTLNLSKTGVEGVEMEFWAASSFGDQSKRYSALIRVVPVDDVAELKTEFTANQWIMDVLSSQWRGNPPAGCSETWRGFAEISGPPQWLQTEREASRLASTEPLAFLAGRLIRYGSIDARGCPSGGLLETGAANACGLERGREMVIRWQNQFDEDILRSARLYRVPPRVLKNIFDRESQFWPGIYETYGEVGFGHMTENGADMVLMWNADFFKSFCPSVFSSTGCEKGYFQLSPNQQRILRGALLSKVNAYCPGCPDGMDLQKARTSIDVFAASLQASCHQTNQIFYNITNKFAGEVASYEDLWRFTLVNYNAGAGCLHKALHDSYLAGESLTWANVSQRLEKACQGALLYAAEAEKIAEP